MTRIEQARQERTAEELTVNGNRILVHRSGTHCSGCHALQLDGEDSSLRLGRSYPMDTVLNETPGEVLQIVQSYKKSRGHLLRRPKKS